MKYSIIIPCYNEEKNLQELINRLLPIRESFPVEFLLVENGSRDGSRQYFKEHIEGKYSNIETVYVDRNQGYGYGIQQGLRAASGDYLGWLHADMQSRPENLIRFFEEIERHSPEEKLFLKARRTNRSPYELVFTYGQAVFTSILFQRIMTDVAAVPFVFNRSMLEEVPIQSMPNDFSIDIFVYWQAVRLRYTIIRPVVEIQQRKHGTSSWNRGLRSRISASCRIMRSSIQIRRGKKVL